jgi:hypothetical protein
MPERGVLRRKPALRPKGRGEQRQEKAEQREHGSPTVGDSPTKSKRMEFSVHTGIHGLSNGGDKAVCALSGVRDERNAKEASIPPNHAAVPPHSVIHEKRKRSGRSSTLRAAVRRAPPSETSQRMRVTGGQ